jgi:E3 ubiquitin-protein ligase UHRF1
LGLDKFSFEPKATPRHLKKKHTNTPKNSKRKAEEGDVGSPAKAKVQRTHASADVSVVTTGVRRSQRNMGKSVDYTKERVEQGPIPIAVKSRVRSLENEGPLGRGAGSKRIHNP